jgi:hypothetical protein
MTAWVRKGSSRIETTVKIRDDSYLSGALLILFRKYRNAELQYKIIMGKKTKEPYRSGSKPLLWVLLLLLFGAVQLPGQNVEKKVLLQGFWWNYDHAEYIPHWSNYLADLAPRLQEMGIDAVWIPPTIKNDFNPASVGYAPFDHYDLGDKYQKGQKETRMGNKDELLRMVAILHANGVEVIQDIVPNHVIGAGDLCGQGLDPAAQEILTRTSATFVSKRLRRIAMWIT